MHLVEPSLFIKIFAVYTLTIQTFSHERGCIGHDMNTRARICLVITGHVQVLKPEYNTVWSLGDDVKIDKPCYEAL